MLGRFGKSSVAVCALAGGLFTMPARPAWAGNASHIGVAAVTDDGSHYAVFQSLDGMFGSCGLMQQAPAPGYEAPGPRIVSALCVNSEQALLPVEEWRWARRPPEISALRAFHPDQVRAAPVRISRDVDSRVARIEIQHGGQWYPILVDSTGGVTEVPLELRYGSPEITNPSDWQVLTGFVRSKDGYLIRLLRSKVLVGWDEILLISDVDVPNVAARRELPRRMAAAHTLGLREQHRTKSGVFIATPAGPQNQLVRKRNRAAAAREGVRLWERTAAYAPLEDSDVRDALWLLAWLDTPTRRLQALRWYLGLRDRNPGAAETILRELEGDRETAWLAEHLRVARDPLRNLPDVAGGTITDAALAGLSAEELHWLHRAQWAAQGGYRFTERAVRDYFEQFPWYCPIPEQDWPRWQSRSFLADPDAPLLRAQRAAFPSGAHRGNLEAILRAERARGLAPPKL